MRTALVAGSTGLIGEIVLKLLLEDDSYSKVYSLTRRTTGITHSKLTEIIIDYEKIGELQFPSVNDVFCALGTTMKKAGSQEAFYRVDYHYVVELAKAAKRHGAAQFMVVSSIMANPNSKSFYLRVKGQMEQAVKWEGPHTVLIFRPATLVGKRQEKRMGEMIGTALMNLISPFFVGSLRRLRNIKAETVARFMIVAAKANLNTKQVFESDEISVFKNRSTFKQDSAD